MKKEKAIRINLPDGAEYRRVEVTDGGISIIYAEEIANDTAKASKTVSKALPKPTPLTGGTEVYQKEGLPYWYCRIKEGRDEFMHLYFRDLTYDDILYFVNGKKRKFVTEEQKEFSLDVIKALENMPAEGFSWIPVYEPSKDIYGNLQYVSGANVFINGINYNWVEDFKNYSPENGSRMASITTYFLLLLRFLKDGFATIEQLADDSKEIGHYFDSKNSKQRFEKLEKTGERQFGGLYGFAGNTRKIVSEFDIDHFSIVGGVYNRRGKDYPLAYVSHDIRPYHTIDNNCVGLLELTK